MNFILFLNLCGPVIWFLAPLLLVAWSRMRRRAYRYSGRPLPQIESGGGSPSDLAGALLFLSLAYRPNHAFVAKAQIQQEEDTDDDENGDPETPLKHFHRQLRCVRRGEPVERLIWRLE